MTIWIDPDEVVGRQDLVEVTPHFVREEQVGDPHSVRAGQRDVFQALAVVFEAVVLPLLTESQLRRVHLQTNAIV